jgi:dihydropteroate synthase
MKLHARNLTLDLSSPQVMGILNVTPDSFSDGGKFNSLPKAIQHASKMITEGASIIDVGGESSRPGAQHVSTDEELSRVIPVIEAISRRFGVWISVDTSKPEVIKQASYAGVHIINDIRALQLPGALEAAAMSDLPVCLMHMQGQPQTMQVSPKYNDIVTDLNTFFMEQILRCKSGGIRKENLILDPGFGFGKTKIHNYQMLANLKVMSDFGLPLLIGLSRKIMHDSTGHSLPTDRVIESVACAVIAAMQGVQIIRVHDVKETVEALKAVTATRKIITASKNISQAKSFTGNPGMSGRRCND